MAPSMASIMILIAGISSILLVTLFWFLLLQNINAALSLFQLIYAYARTVIAFLLDTPSPRRGSIQIN
jgi:hypothetical protein